MRPTLAVLLAATLLATPAAARIAGTASNYSLSLHQRQLNEANDLQLRQLTDQTRLLTDIQTNQQAQLEIMRAMLQQQAQQIELQKYTIQQLQLNQQSQLPQ